jgi:hypothetical protein
VHTPLVMSLCIGAAMALAPFANAAEPAVTLSVRPLLCVVDQFSPGCMMTFDIRWKSFVSRELCLNDSVQATPLLCWASAQTGDTKQQRLVTEDFAYWLASPSGTERVAEVKIEVLRTGSADRRRDRRARHVWDVL